MKYLMAAVLAGAVPLAGAAQDWALRSGDTVLSRAEMQAELVVQDIVFYDNGRSQFGAGGAYAYTYDQGGTAFGQYTLRDDGVICIAYRNGFGRCDKYVRNGGRLVVITEDGDRFPVRP